MKRSKGDRLNWTPLKEIQPVRLTSALTKGKRLSKADLKIRQVSVINQNIFLVP